jgi:hypothetical protein
MNVRQLTHDSPQIPAANENAELKHSAIRPCPLIRPEALSYHRLALSEMGPLDAALLGKAYECWSSVWHDTLYELDHVENVPSDEFTRQDEIGALFHEFDCVGLSCLRWLNLENPIFRDDSYFKVWSPEALRTASEFGSEACILSNLTVAPAYRRVSDINVAETLLGLAIDRFEHSRADVLIGTPRADRRVNKLAYRIGFCPIAPDVTHHGVKIDIVGYYRKTATGVTLSEPVESAVRHLRMP